MSSADAELAKLDKIIEDAWESEDGRAVISSYYSKYAFRLELGYYQSEAGKAEIERQIQEMKDMPIVTGPGMEPMVFEHGLFDVIPEEGPGVFRKKKQVVKNDY